MKLKAVKNETKKEYLTKKEQYQKIKNKAGKIGISTALMFLLSGTSYAVSAQNDMLAAGVLPFEPEIITEPPLALSIIGLIQGVLILAGIIFLVVNSIKFIVNREKEDADKKLNRNLIVTILLFSIAYFLKIVEMCCTNGKIYGPNCIEYGQMHIHYSTIYILLQNIIDMLILIASSAFATMVLKSIVRKKPYIVDAVEIIILFVLATIIGWVVQLIQ